MGLTRQFFTFIFAAFLPQTIDEIQIPLFLKTNGRCILILLPVSILALLLLALCDFASGLIIFHLSRTTHSGVMM